MDANTKRPWYRLHWGTVITVALASLAWLDLAFPGTVGGILFGGEGEYGYAIIDGWPWVCVYEVPGSTRFDGAMAIADAAVILACLSSIAFVVERLERARMRMQLLTIFAVTAVVAVVLCYWRWDAVQQETYYDFSIDDDSDAAFQVDSTASEGYESYADKGLPWERKLGGYQPLSLTTLQANAVFYLSLCCLTYSSNRRRHSDGCLVPRPPPSPRSREG